jgi:hypothetical protein
MCAMGLEAQCTAEHGDATSSGKALLETDALLFKGTFRLAIPLRGIRKVVVRDGRLEIAFGRERVVLHLGTKAERWAQKIRNPPSVVDKLGVKPEMRVGLVGPADEALVAAMRARGAELTVDRPRKGSDLVFLFASRPGDLGRLPALGRAIAPAGAVWVVWPKGQPELKEDHVRAAAREAGLVDVKVASVSERLSGLKLMIPRARR